MKELDSEEGPAAGSEAETGIHTVLVVDNSGSMRKTDVPGYPSRTAAVYDCLARDFLQPQLVAMADSGQDKRTHVVSLIEMSDTATVIFNRHPIDEELTRRFKERADMRACSHGNYLPALDKLLELLRRDAAHGRQLFLLFLSDGAPSDHTDIPCEHGVMVWQEETGAVHWPNLARRQRGKVQLTTCRGGDPRACRAGVKQQVTDQCAQRIQQIGDLYGRDRTYIGTVAFGPPGEDYAVLQTMAAQLPRGSFQKLGLSALQLRTAFSSLTSSLTSLRTDGCARPLTQRALQMERDGARGSDGWDVYRISDGDAISKQRYDLACRKFVAAPYEQGSDGVAHSRNCFGQGAERVVFHCMEVDGEGTPVGPRLVAKQTRFEELMHTPDFHHTFCRTQAEAEALAVQFNRRTLAPSAWAVSFLDCVVYNVRDERWPGGRVQFLAEQELEGRFIKWNNNAGAVRAHPASPASTGRTRIPTSVPASKGLGIIGEEDEDEDEDEEKEEEEEDEGSDSLSNENAQEGRCSRTDEARIEDVPQCFSHFTYEATDGEKLVCDLQGIWNKADGFVLTDPVIHTTAGRRRRAAAIHTVSRGNGKTDKGVEGVRLFFASHRCNALCRRLGLKPGLPPASEAK